MATDLLNAGMGDAGRLQFILECIQKKKPLYNTDEKYLIQKYNQFETKLNALSGGKKKATSTMVTDHDLDKIVDRALSKEKQSRAFVAQDTTPQTQQRSFFKKMFGKK